MPAAFVRRVSSTWFIAPAPAISPSLYDKPGNSAEVLEVSGNKLFIILEGYRSYD
jgi:hypothetical protein